MPTQAEMARAELARRELARRASASSGSAARNDFAGARAGGQVTPPRSAASRVYGGGSAVGQGVLDTTLSTAHLSRPTGAVGTGLRAGAGLVQQVTGNTQGANAVRAAADAIDPAAQQIAAIPRYQPRGAVERNLEVVGRNVPNALFPGGLVARGVSVALPVVGHMVGQAVGGDTGGAVGETVGGLASGIRTAPRAAPASPAARAATALRRGGRGAVDPVAMRARQAEASAAGVDASLVDLTDTSGRRIIRAAASRPGEGQAMAEQYNRQRNLDLPGRVGEHASRIISPNDAGAARTAIEARVNDAMNTPPVVAPGEGGAQVSARLNEARDASWANVNAAYDRMRAANPQQAIIPRSEIPQVADALQASVQPFDPVRVPAVQREIQRYSPGLTDVTAEDLFRSRSILTNLAASNDPVEAAAARAARNAIDAEITRTEPMMQGDAQSIQLWREANAARRLHGQTYEGNDLTQRITDRSVHGSGTTNTLAPEDVSNAVLGTSGVSARQNLTRDLARVRDQLGANSPEWAAFQNEAMDRILSRDAGTPRYGRDLRDFRRNNPGLATLLVRPDRATNVAAAQATIARGTADMAALDAGGRFLQNKSPRPLVRAYGAMTPNENALARSAAANAVIDEAGKGRGINALSVADQLAEGPNQVQINNALLGPQDANTLGNAMRLEALRVRNAQAINPSTGSGSHMNIATDNLLSGAADAGQTAMEVGRAGHGDVTAVFSLLRRMGGRLSGLSDADALNLVQHATSNDPATVNAVIAEVDRLAGQPGAGNRFIQAIGQARLAGVIGGATTALSPPSQSQ